MGVEGPMRENNSREMPSGFLTADEPVRLGCEGPADMLGSMESALRMSAAEAFMVVDAEKWAVTCATLHLMMCQK